MYALYKGFVGVSPGLCASLLQAGRMRAGRNTAAAKKRCLSSRNCTRKTYLSKDVRSRGAESRHVFPFVSRLEYRNRKQVHIALSSVQFYQLCMMDLKTSMKLPSQTVSTLDLHTFANHTASLSIIKSASSDYQ